MSTITIALKCKKALKCKQGISEKKKYCRFKQEIMTRQGVCLYFIKLTHLLTCVCVNWVGASR